MTFQHPHMLWLLVALVPLAWLWNAVRRRRERRLAAFVERGTWPLLNAVVSTRARWWRTVLVFGAVALSIVAAARPQWGARERVVQERGIDIIVAIDVSQSMLATDIEPNRLEQSKRRFRELLTRFPGNRIGVMPFAGEAFLQVPLTSDYGLALKVLDSVDTRTIGTQGTNIADAIARARRAFREGGMGTPVLLLITDGEGHEGDVLEEARLAAAEGVRIFSLGIGTPQGSAIRLADNRLLEDSEGHKVLSRLDAETLRRIAEITGGQSFVARPGDEIDIAPLVAQLGRLERAQFGEESRRLVREERFQIPLALALMLLFVEGLFGDRRKIAPRAATRPQGAPA